MCVTTAIRVYTDVILCDSTVLYTHTHTQDVLLLFGETTRIGGNVSIAGNKNVDPVLYGPFGSV